LAIKNHLIIYPRHKKKQFLYQIITDDEKWSYYDNPKFKKSFVSSGQPWISTLKHTEVRFYCTFGGI